MAYHSYEPFVTRVFLSLLREGITVLDIGAAWGYYSLLAAEKVGPKGRIIAFEADPRNYKALLNTARGRHTSNIIVLPFAVAEKSGLFRFYSTGVFGNSSLYYKKGEGRVFTVKGVSLDEFLPTDMHVDLVKMDIDGGELFALRGMRNLIRRSAFIAIITEFAPDLLADSGVDPSLFMEELIGHDFKIYLIDSLGESLINLDKKRAMTLASSKGGMLLLIRKKGQDK